jgi:hypothetical protein
MKTGACYFYTDQVKWSTSKTPSLTPYLKKKHYTVLFVHVFNGNIDEAERKARTINDKLCFGKMPGGYFINKCIPCNLEEDYTIIKVPDNTKIQPLNDHDKFIIALIECESNMDYTIL